ncbi:11560_t:CDS:1, partial [Ambispora leptoticha]
NATQIHEELMNVEGEQALSISIIRCWIAMFKNREEEIKDNAHSGCSHEVVISEKISRIEDLVSDDSHISIKELTNKVGIFRERISYILHEELNLHKLYAK